MYTIYLITSVKPMAPAKFDKETELVTLRDILADSGIDAVEKWKDNYTPEDWNWLQTKLSE
jgi:hypothetical protein